MKAQEKVDVEASWILCFRIRPRSARNIQAATRHILETMCFEAEWCGKLFQIKVFCAAIDSAKLSSKLELSWGFFGCLKFSVLFGYLSLVKGSHLELEAIPPTK